MTTDIKELNLFQRIIKVREQVKYAQKDKSVSTGGGSYKAVTHDQVTAIVREHMNTYGIVCVPNMESSVMNQKEEGAKQQRYDAIYTFTFINADKPDDSTTVRPALAALPPVAAKEKSTKNFPAPDAWRMAP